MYGDLMDTTVEHIRKSPANLVFFLRGKTAGK